MKKTLFLVIAMTFVLCSCGKKNDTLGDVSTVNTIYANASYGEDMVTMIENDSDTGKTAIKYYNPKTKEFVYACGKANCAHNTSSEGDISCDAIFEESICFPFLYKGNLFYFLEGGKTALYKCNADGSNKSKIKELDFKLYDYKIAFNDGKVYVMSYNSFEGEEDENGATMVESAVSELYEIDIDSAKTTQITSFGKKADIGCTNMTLSENKLYLGLYYQNKNIYDSEFKTWDKYEKWLSNEKNPYKESREKFDVHNDYYCINLKDNSVDKLNINYEMNYDGMNDVKDFYDFNLIATDEKNYYYATNYGEGYTFYKYNLETNKQEVLDEAYRMTYTYYDNKIYLEKTQYDPDKDLGWDESENKSIPPEYKCYNMKTEQWEDLKFKQNLEGKQLRIEAASDKYVYGVLCDFIDQGEEESGHNLENQGVGEMSAIEIDK